MFPVKLVERGVEMIIITNNIELDEKVKCIKNETIQTKIAEEIGTTKSYVNRIIKKQESVINKTSVQIMEHWDMTSNYIM